MGLHTCLEEIERCRSVGVGRNILAGSILDNGHLADERHHITQELHQTAYTHVATCADTEYGENRTCNEALADTLTHLVLCQILTLEELLHQRVVASSSSLYQSGLHLLGLVELIGRNLLNDRSATLGLPRVFLHQQHIDNAVEARASSDRILYRHAVRTIDILQLRENLIEVAIVTIQLVNQEDHGLLQLLRVAESVHRAHLRTVLAIDENHSLIGHVHSGDRAAHEVVRARTVDDVELLVVPLHMKNS